MALSVYARKETARLPVSGTKTNRDFQTDKSAPPHKLTAWKKRNSVDFSLLLTNKLLKSRVQKNFESMACQNNHL